MVIPTDIRQFQLKHMFWLALSFCVPLSLLSHSPFFGLPLLVAVSCFWTGMVLLFISDNIDNGPIDERGWMSQFFNLIGFFMVAFSVIAIILLVLFTVIAVISIITFGVQK